MLNIANYDSTLDDLYYDYADYSKNPQKYGFKTINFNPSFWEHETMNSSQAKDLAIYSNNKWGEKYPSCIRSIWNYPALRTLGISHNEILELSRNSNINYIEDNNNMLYKKEQVFLQKYHKTLLEKNGN